MTFFIFLLLLNVIFLLSFVDKVFSCRAMVFPNGCCHYSSFFHFFECRQAHYPKCNFFGRNCVACIYIYTTTKCDVVKTRCSCYYCCDPQYAATCPDGCKNCVKDGEGGCPENSMTSAAVVLKSDDNSSLISLGPMGKAQEHFDTIDADKSGDISLKEAIAYLVETKNGTSADHLANNTSWFGEMDSDGNSRIEPGEFDQTLKK